LDLKNPYLSAKPIIKKIADKWGLVRDEKTKAHKVTKKNRKMGEDRRPMFEIVKQNLQFTNFGFLFDILPFSHS
jgi:hypothetical protein